MCLAWTFPGTALDITARNLVGDVNIRGSILTTNSRDAICAISRSGCRSGRNGQWTRAEKGSTWLRTRLDQTRNPRHRERRARYVSQPEACEQSTSNSGLPAWNRDGVFHQDTDTSLVSSDGTMPRIAEAGDSRLRAGTTAMRWPCGMGQAATCLSALLMRSNMEDGAIIPTPDCTQALAT